MITQHFILHMVPDTVRPKIYLSQRSTGLEKLQFTLIGTNGQYYQIPQNTSVTLVGSKPDKKTFSYACTYSGSTVVCDVTDQMTAVAGLVTAELRFANSSGELIPSQNMDLVIERSPLDGSICSKNDFASVEDEIQSIAQDAANAKKYAEQAEAAGTQAVSEITAAKETAESDITSAVSTGEANITSTANSATSSITSTANSATSSINSTKNEAISAVNAKSAETIAAFNEIRNYIEQYGVAGVAIEYVSNTEALRIIPNSAN